MNIRRRTIFGILLILVALALGLGIAGLYWMSQQLQPVALAQQEPMLFVVPKGATTTKVASLLLQKGLIRNELAFRLYARQVGFDQELQAGSYNLSATQSMQEIIATFLEGSQALWVTLPEGLRVEEIAQRLATADLTDFDQEEFVALAKPSEGRLFPDTYLLPRESTAQQLFAMLTRTFHDKIEVKLAADLQNNSRPLSELIVLASLVQREGNSASDMKKVAGVINNRLRLGMKLDIDATLSYVRGYDSIAQSWWSAPDPTLKSLDSPYNTYVVAGLPPAPIANPGLDAMQAALDPDDTSALFYLHAPSGQAYYANTYEEHLRHIERYLR